jgi:hypothetical protein
LKEDLILAIQGFFKTKQLQGWKAPFLSLIPKNKDPCEWGHFRPINLGNMNYKVVTKIIGRRLETFLLRIISREQNAYIKGRFIGDYVGIA